MKTKTNQDEVKWCVIACQVLGCWDCLRRNRKGCVLTNKSRSG